MAALVTELDAEKVRVTLVNTNQVEARELIVQTGSYGEHQVLRVEAGGPAIPVENRYVGVRLAPGAGATLTVYMQRYANAGVSLAWTDRPHALMTGPASWR